MLIIPKSEHKTARITLKATAGLRLISDKKADNILEEVKKLFTTYPFYFNDNHIEILDGKYEGIYSWVTLMYAQGKTCFVTFVQKKNRINLLLNFINSLAFYF